MKEPLLGGVTSTPSLLTARFLSEPYYNEKKARFRKYDPALWGPTLKIDVSGFMLIPWVSLVTLTTMLCFAGKVFPFIMPILSLTPQVHTVLGGALAFVMVFRTNTAYSRWWEARLLWGVVNNTTRSVVARAGTMVRNRAVYTQLVTELVTFAVLLKNHLRGEKTGPGELSNMLPFEMIAKLNEAVNPPLAAIEALGQTIHTGIKTELPADALVANASFLQLSTALDALANTVGACERVKNTPTPFGYVSSLRGFLLMWLFTMPLTMIGAYGFVSIPAMGLVGFLFLNLEVMAMEIEQPFGDDADDLPLEEYVLGIERVCLDFLKRCPLK